MPKKEPVLLVTVDVKCDGCGKTIFKDVVVDKRVLPYIKNVTKLCITCDRRLDKNIDRLLKQR